MILLKKLADFAKIRESNLSEEHESMAIQIFILSKLMEENTYPYKLKKKLSEPIPLDRLGGLTESKLYYHFDVLVRQGLIEPVKIIKEENRPDKQVFAITNKGREVLPKKIYSLFEKADTISEMTAGIASIHYAERDKVIEILERKRERILKQWDQIKYFESKLQVTEGNKSLVEFIGSYISHEKDERLYWIDALAERIRAREL